MDHLFTNEPLIPTWIYWFNALLGKVHMNPFLTYNVALILLVIGVLTLIWHIVNRSITDPITKHIAFIFVISASNFFDFATFFRDGTLKLLGDFWFSPTPALNRLGGVPHQVLQTILCLSVILLHEKLTQSSKKTSLQLVALFTISFLASAANPIQMLLVSLTLLAVLVWKIYKKHYTSRDLVAISTVLLPTLLGALATNFEFSHHPILTAAKVWENNQRFSLSMPQFFWAMGPIGAFIPFGVYTAIKKHTTMYLTLVVYTLLSLIFFFTPLPTLLDTSPVRWLSPASYIGLTLLAASGFVWCIKFIDKKTKQFQLVLLIALISYLLLTIPAVVTQIHARTAPLATDSRLIALNHIPYDVIDGLIQIQNSETDGVVICDPALFYDVIIPAITGKKSFTGHPIHTLYPDTKEALRQELFSGSMNELVAKEFMKNHSITFVVADPNHSVVFNGYTFLKVLFSNKSLIIYQKTP